MTDCEMPKCDVDTRPEHNMYSASDLQTVWYSLTALAAATDTTGMLRVCPECYDELPTE